MTGLQTESLRVSAMTEGHTVTETASATITAMTTVMTDRRVTESLTATETVIATATVMTDSPAKESPMVTETTTAATDSSATVTTTEETTTETAIRAETTAGIQSLHSRPLPHSRLSTLQISRRTHLLQSTSRVKLYREANRSQSTLIQEAAM